MAADRLEGDRAEARERRDRELPVLRSSEDAISLLIATLNSDKGRHESRFGQASPHWTSVERAITRKGTGYERVTPELIRTARAFEDTRRVLAEYFGVSFSDHDALGGLQGRQVDETLRVMGERLMSLPSDWEYEPEDRPGWALTDAVRRAIEALPWTSVATEAATGALRPPVWTEQGTDVLEALHQATSEGRTEVAEVLEALTPQVERAVAARETLVNRRRIRGLSVSGAHGSYPAAPAPEKVDPSPTTRIPRAIAPGEALTGSVGRIRTRLQDARAAVKDIMPGGARYGPARGEEVLEPGRVAGVDLRAEQDLGLVPMDITGPDEAARAAAEAGSDAHLLNIFDKIDRHEEEGRLSEEEADLYRAELAPLLGWADEGRRNPFYLTEEQEASWNEEQIAAFVKWQLENEDEKTQAGGAAMDEAVNSGAAVAGNDQPEYWGPDSPELRMILWQAGSDLGARMADRIAENETEKLDRQIKNELLQKTISERISAGAEAKNAEAISALALLTAETGLERERGLLRDEALERTLAAGPRHDQAVASRSQDLIGKTYGKGGIAEFKHDFDYFLQMHMKVAELSKVPLDPGEISSSFMAMVGVDVKPHIRAGLERRAREVLSRGGHRRARQTSVAGGRSGRLGLEGGAGVNGPPATGGGVGGGGWPSGVNMPQVGGQY
jgi:hypothetical protein